jgi:hypothetical protein
LLHPVSKQPNVSATAAIKANFFIDVCLLKENRRHQSKCSPDVHGVRTAEYPDIQWTPGYFPADA